ncbi:MAG: bifunctional germination protease/germinant receptor pseudoprotease CspBA [Peptostreptococcaceae bacterium]
MEAIKIDYEVIVKYNGDILKLQEEIGVLVELLGYNYAIIISDTEDKINQLTNYSQIEYVEKPFILGTQDSQSFSSTGITKFKRNTSLTGKGTILGIIDSGIDYNLDIFKDKEGKSKILYYWDQSINGNPPDGFNEGSLYTNEDINKAINGDINIPVSPTSTHGTHVAGIACEIADEAKLIVARVGRRQTDIFSKSSEFMRAIKFILDKALELKMPVTINISYGSNEGSHKGLSLFEQYIDDMCSFWKNNIVVAAGNNGNKGGHKNINIKDKEKVEVEFTVGENEKILNINIWPDFIDDFNIYLISPSNKQTQPISLTSGEVKNIIGTTKIKGYFYPIPPYALIRRVTIQMSSNTFINSGIWKIVFEPINVVEGNVDIYLPTSEGISKDTKFLNPNKTATITVPGTAKKVITVGSFNSRTDIPSIFSGEGDIKNGVYKPDLLAPGEDIISYLPGGNKGALTGTSMATPHVSGCCALLMEWGIVKKNDLFLYSQKTKTLLIKYARRNPQNNYPNNLSGYGFLDLSKIELNDINDINKENGVVYTSSIKKKRKKLESTNIKREAKYIPAINIYHTEAFGDDVKNIGIDYKMLRVSDDFSVIYIDREFENIQSIMNLESVVRVIPVIRMSQLSKISLGTQGGTTATEDIGVNFIKNNPNISITGNGVLIGIADSGIDYLHEDFIYPDGSSKIAYLWDQTKEGKPPEGYYIGSEYTREDINNAIKNKDATLSKDEEGNGTMLSGICAGLGNINKEYSGICEGSDLIVVKLAKANDDYINSFLIAASDYMRAKSKQLDMPIVINTSLGSNELVGLDGRINGDKDYFNRGICQVVGCGDEGNTQTHTSGKVSFKGEVNEIELEVFEDEKEIEMQIWVNKPDKISVAILSPGGEISKEVEVSNYNIVTGIFDLERVGYSIVYVYPTSFSGQQQTIINLYDVKKGIWKIKLKGEYITNGIYNMYLENRVFLKPQTKFRNPSPNNTINYPATYDDVISVGAYNTTEKSLWAASSRGPTIVGELKPDIVAPGVNIIAPYPGNKYAKITGTAVAAAHVSGACSLFMENTLVTKLYPYKDYVQKIRTYIRGGAIRDEDRIYPNNSYGYGQLDVRGMFEQLK